MHRLFQFSGRTLKNTAESTLRSVKIANSFALRLLNGDGTQLHSGWSIEDLILSVLDQMTTDQKALLVLILMRKNVRDI